MIFLVFFKLILAFSIRLRWRLHGQINTHNQSHPTSANCTVHYFKQNIDHFGWGSIHTEKGSFETFNQRYFVYDKFWRAPDCSNGIKPGPIFFYTGNEAPVDLYVNNTGLMWENAQDFEALLLFAEHRYWGESCPFWHPCGDNANKTTLGPLKYLTYDQALADYATLIYHFKLERNALDASVIAFGGSYGGILAYMMRQKYPGVISGAIAASAPLLTFLGWVPDPDSETYWQVVTRGANETGGAPANCASNIRKSFDAMYALGSSAKGRDDLTEIFSLCQHLNKTDDIDLLYKLQLFSFDTLSMGNYPYESNYLTGGGPNLPAFPLRYACQYMNTTFTDPDGKDLLAALSNTTKVVNNATKKEKCISLPSRDSNDGQDCVLCDYFMCTSGNILETYFPRDGKRDMFLPFKDPSGPMGGVNISSIEERCKRLYQTKPRWHWIRAEYSGHAGIRSTTNVFYSNGFLDQWSALGISWMDRSDSKSVLIDDAAHHLDLMFSHPDDPQSVISARKMEMEYIRKWIDEWDQLRSKTCTNVQ